MTLDEIRQYLTSYREDVQDEAESFKDSYIVVERLRALYKRFDADKRRLANKIFTEWLSVDDEGLRFDALVMIDDFKIVEAMTSLQKLAANLAVSEKPGAPYELKKVNRSIEELREEMGHPNSNRRKPKS